MSRGLGQISVLFVAEWDSQDQAKMSNLRLSVDNQGVGEFIEQQYVSTIIITVLVIFSHSWF